MCAYIFLIHFYRYKQWLCPGVSPYKWTPPQRVEHPFLWSQVRFSFSFLLWSFWEPTAEPPEWCYPAVWVSCLAVNEIRRIAVECSSLTVPLLCKSWNTLTKLSWKLHWEKYWNCICACWAGMHNNYFQPLQCTAGQRSPFRTRNFIYFLTIGIESFDIMLAGVAGFIYFIPLGLKLLLRQF